MSTDLELAGAEIPDRMQGRSIVPLLHGESPPDWRDAVYYHYFEGPLRVHRVARHFGVRTGQYTLVHFPDHNEWELFDLETDPNQLTSVYGDPDYEEIKQQLKNKIIELQEQYGDDSWGE